MRTRVLSGWSAKINFRCGSLALDMNTQREYDFVEQPSKQYFCPVTFAVLLEPYQTRCCGNHLSQEAYQRLQGQPCPVCEGQEKLTAVDDKFHKRKVLSLKVRCPHKVEGCEWEGELGSLEQHLNTNTDISVGIDCIFVDVDCPYSCGERVQRRCLEEHKSQHCPLRPFTCQYCNHEATYQKVTKEHWPVCEKYPLPCPNECGEEEIERQHLKGHLEQTCPLEVIQCEYSYAGCGAQLQRCLMSAHMKECTEVHLSLAAQVSKKVPELEKIVQQQGDQIKQQGDQIKQQGDQIKQQEDQIKQQEDQIKQQEDQIKQQGDQIEQQRDQIKQQEGQIKQQGDQIKQQGDQIKQQGDQIKQQGEKIKQQEDQLKQQVDQIEHQIKQQGDQICSLMKLQLGKFENVPPVDFNMNNFEEHKTNNDYWYSPLFYSHAGGYKMCLKVDANGFGAGKGTHVSVSVCLMKGEFDDYLKWPFNGRVTVQLKNTDRPSHQEIITIDENALERCVSKPTEERNLGWGYFNYISHNNLYADGGYPSNNKLLFCVTDIVVKSK